MRHKRLVFFDFLKGVAILAVIAVHAADFTPHASILKVFLWFALPLFIFESGYLLSIRHDNDLDLKEYLKHILSRIFVIYLFFVIMFRLILGQEFTAKEIFLDVIFGRTSGNYYFIPIILQFYLLYPLLRKFKKYFKNYFVFNLLYLIGFLFYLLDSLLQKPEWNSNPFSLAFFGRFFFYFCFGMILAEYDINKIRWKHTIGTVVIFGISMIFFRYYGGSWYLTYLYPLIILLLFLKIHNFFGDRKFKIPIINHIGKLSLIIYLVHIRLLYDFIAPYVA